MLWSRFLPPPPLTVENEAAASVIDRRIDAIRSHQTRVLEALDRELELYKLTIPAHKDSARDAQR
jgi:hypothetical protein